MSSKIAFNPQDRFVVALGTRIAVITEDGSVFGHEMSGRHSGEAFRLTGSKAAFNRAVDRFVVTIGDRLIVTTQNGDVFGHDVSGDDVGAPIKFTGSRVRVQWAHGPVRGDDREHADRHQLKAVTYSATMCRGTTSARRSSSQAPKWRSMGPWTGSW